MKKLDLAIERYDEAELLDKTCPKVYLRKACCYKKLHDFKNATEYFEKAIHLEKQSKDLIFKQHLIDHILYLSFIYFRYLDDFDKALKHARSVFEFERNEKQEGEAYHIIGRI